MGRMGQDYQYSIDAWLQDLEMELSNAGEHKKRVEFCRRILEMLDWSFDDASNFKSAIGEELYAEGKVEQGRKRNSIMTYMMILHSRFSSQL